MAASVTGPNLNTYNVRKMNSTLNSGDEQAKSAAGNRALKEAAQVRPLEKCYYKPRKSEGDGGGGDSNLIY